MYVSTLKKGEKMKLNTNVQIIKSISENQVIQNLVLVCFIPVLLWILHPIRVHKKTEKYAEVTILDKIFINFIMFAKQEVL